MRGGSKGLGTAVNETVVLCVVALYAVNVILTTIGVRFGTGADMSTIQVLRARFPRATANLSRYGGAAGRELSRVGQMAWFAVEGATGLPGRCGITAGRCCG
ncbi:conserved membrane domain protein [Mycobacterium xenopi 3993]|nr:conserved membrane domain protein [Mycobacterium xenopi 3993]